MKAPNYRYLRKSSGQEKPENEAELFFSKWESIFDQQVVKRGKVDVGVFLESIWAKRKKGSFLDKLDSEPEEDRALALWMALQCGRWCPYDKFDVEAYFAKSTSR